MLDSNRLERLLYRLCDWLCLQLDSGLNSRLNNHFDLLFYLLGRCNNRLFRNLFERLGGRLVCNHIIIGNFVRHNQLYLDFGLFDSLLLGNGIIDQSRYRTQQVTDRLDC